MAASLVNTLNGVLKTYSSARKVYKRVTTRTGGDALIGRQGKTTVVDTLFSPQPFGDRGGITVTAYGVRDSSELAVGSSGPTVNLDVYEFMFSADATSEDELRDNRVSLVLKDSQGREEVLTIIDAKDLIVSGTRVMVSVYARSAKR